MTFKIWIAVMLCWASHPFVAGAQDIEVLGEVSAEMRGFPEGPRQPGQFGGLQPSVTAEAEVEANVGANNRVRFVPFIRVDSRDSGRTHFDVREFVWQRFGDGWDLRVGVDRVFWGVTESRHLVDVINQVDFPEDLDGEDKLGQPLVRIRVDRDWGSFRFFVMPGFRQRTFPGPKGRPGFGLPVDTSEARYENSSGRRHVDFAVRYTNSWNAWDIGVSFFRGTGREPRLIPDASGKKLIPFYAQTAQLGLDAQYTKGAWLWKLEALVREGHGSTFAAAVGGVEYTIYGLGGRNIDLGLLFEYLYDGRDRSAPATSYDDDVFAGTRVALNDTQNTSILVGAVVDRNDGGTLLSLEAERRLGSQWLVEVESRIFLNINSMDPLASFDGDSWLTARLSWFF